jgi:hypothetical protein
VSLVVENLDPNTPVKQRRAQGAAAGAALSPFLRDTIGHGLSSPIAGKAAATQTVSSEQQAAAGRAAPSGVDVQEMDAVLLSELGHLLRADAAKLFASADMLKSGGVVVLAAAGAKRENAAAGEQVQGAAAAPILTATAAAVATVGGEHEQGEQRLGASDKYRGFFKALKMGVPPPAVKQRMLREGAAPDVLDLGPDAPVSAAEAVEAAFAEAQRAKAAAPAPAAPGRKTRIRWEPIPEERLANRTTIWASGRARPDLNTSELESLFVEQPAGGAKQPAGGAKQPVGVRSRLDPRRAQSVSIGVAKLKLSGGALAQALERMDAAVLTPAVVQIVQGCGLVPSGEEAQMLQALDGALAEPDAFLRALARLADAGARVETMAFRYVCEETMAQTEADAELVVEACRQVRGSPRLKDLLHVVLVVGNRINGGPDGQAVRGFTLASLLKLSQTKSLNKSVSVLEYLVQFIGKKMPDMFDVVAELQAVPRAKRVQLAGLARQERDLRRGLEALKRMPQLAGFAQLAERKLAAVERLLAEARELFSTTIEYFGEDDQMQSNEFFQLLDSFFEALLKTRLVLQERERRKFRQEQQQQQQQQQQARAKAHAESGTSGGTRGRKDDARRGLLVNGEQVPAGTCSILPPALPSAQPQLLQQASAAVGKDAHPHLARFLRELS